jgi:hypothetical protein
MPRKMPRNDASSHDRLRNSTCRAFRQERDFPPATGLKARAERRAGAYSAVRRSNG